MQVTIVPSSPATDPANLFTSYLINGTVAIDAGCLGNAGSVAELSKIRHLFLSHAHLDHTAALPPLLDAVYDGSGDCITVHASASTLDSLRKDIFNNRLWPDFFHISTFRPPYLKVNELVSGQPVQVEGLRLSPVEVNHVLPTLGFVVEDDHSAVLFSSDTAPTEKIWELARACPGLATVFLECTFPDDMAWLAEIAKHLTPDQFAKEIRKLGRPARFLAVHLHARQRTRIVAELMGMELPGVEIGEPGRTYEI